LDGFFGTTWATENGHQIGTWHVWGLCLPLTGNSTKPIREIYDSKDLGIDGRILEWILWK